jgi:hypothetical protein
MQQRVQVTRSHQAGNQLTSWPPGVSLLVRIQIICKKKRISPRYVYYSLEKVKACQVRSLCLIGLNSSLFILEHKGCSQNLSCLIHVQEPYVEMVSMLRLLDCTMLNVIMRHIAVTKNVVMITLRPWSSQTKRIKPLRLVSSNPTCPYID